MTGRVSPGWVADGPCAAEFAATAATRPRGAAGVAVNSGTRALHVALLAMGGHPGSEVLVPAFCCTALLNAVHQAGALPVLVDCRPSSFHPCPQDAARRITPRTSAVVVAHRFGEAVDVDPFLQLALPVVEDCAQSLGARHRGRPAGGLGAAAVTSLYATKLLTTGHGGLVASRCAEVAAVAADRLEYVQRLE